MVSRPTSWFVIAAIVAAVVAVASIVVYAPQTRIAESVRDPHTGMEFVLIRPGTFQMGTPPEEAQREAQEVPHAVRLTKAFYMGRHEVTQAQWMKVMGTNPSHFQSCGPACPVEQVTFFDVEEFIRRLNAASGPGFRLPTEAEWEYACRAGSSEPFGRTASLSSRDSNINGNYPYNAPQGTFRQSPTTVGTFPSNAWGLFDMSGNVWEWVQDRHCPYGQGPVTDPIGQCESPHRVIRGGSWLFDGASARCGLRYTHRPQDKGYSLGVRLVRDVE